MIGCQQKYGHSYLSYLLTLLPRTYKFPRGLVLGVNEVVLSDTTTQVVLEMNSKARIPLLTEGGVRYFTFVTEVEFGLTPVMYLLKGTRPTFVKPSHLP